MKRMKKYLLFFAIIFIVCQGIKAQEFHYGIIAGPTFNRMTLDTEYHINLDKERNPLYLGFKIGVFGENKFNIFGMQYELSYDQLGSRVQWDEEILNTSIMQTKEFFFQRISLDILGKLYILNDYLSIDLGVEPSYIISAMKHEDITIDNRSDKNKTTLKKGDDYSPFNIAVGGGICTYISQNITLSLRYMLELTNTLQKETISITDTGIVNNTIKTLSKNRTFYIMLGWRF